MGGGEEVGDEKELHGFGGLGIEIFIRAFLSSYVLSFVFLVLKLIYRKSEDEWLFNILKVKTALFIPSVIHIIPRQSKEQICRPDIIVGSIFYSFCSSIL